MKQKFFDQEIGLRMRENRQLAERPLLPGRFFSVAALVGRHLFSIMLVVSLGMAIVMTLGFAQQLKWVNALMLFLK